MRKTDFIAVIAALAASVVPGKAQDQGTSRHQYCSRVHANDYLPVAPWYHVSSKTDTDPSAFKQFFDQLGSSSAEVVIEEGAPWQMAYVRLDSSQLEDVKNQTWLDYVTLGDNTTETASDDFLVMPHLADLKPHSSPLQKRAYVEQDPTVAPQLKLISATPPSDTSTEFDPNTNELYRYDDSAGTNQWIYILDTGYDLSISDLQPGDRQIDSFVVPNRITVGDLPETQPSPDQDPLQRYQGPEEINDVGGRIASESRFQGHGTGVASAAAGLNYGVAKKANLFLVKAKGSFFQNRGAGQQSHLGAAYKLEAIERGLLKVIGHFGTTGADRAVINMSWGIGRKEGKEIDVDSEWGKMWKKWIAIAEARNIVMVIAAGNDGKSDNNAPQTRLGDLVPQRFDTLENSLITVGALTGKGAYWEQTTRPGASSHPYPNEPDELIGYQDTYAMGDQSIKYQGVGGAELSTPGTSIAAPQVAGLIAYLFQHPLNGLNWNTGNADIPHKAKAALKCLYDPEEQNGCFQVYWNGPGAVNNGARFNDGASTGGGDGDDFTGVCYTDVSRDLYGQCQWEGDGGIVQVAACAEDSACPGNDSPCTFTTGSSTAQCGA